MSTKATYDYLVIGGGLFGSYAALYAARLGYSVCLVEREDALFKKASVVNQARLHAGYHYPRSVATARMSDDNKERFTRDHQDFIFSAFEKYYAIDKHGSFTDDRQFRRFCEYLDITCEPVDNHPLFNFQRLENVYRTEEHTFDPFLIRNYYKKLLEEEKKITTKLSTEVLEVVGQSGEYWELSLKQGEQIIAVQAAAVINATYAGTNAILKQFGFEAWEIQHEISEIGLLHAPELAGVGLTIMDGPFGSIMPYGKSGLHSISSVAYTHHKVSYDHLPQFDCMHQVSHCSPAALGDCNNCAAQPRSNMHKMTAQMGQYFSKDMTWTHYKSLFTIKSKLQANHIDDGRPTEIKQFSEKPYFYSVFAGKINSIYEIEKVITK